MNSEKNQKCQNEKISLLDEKLPLLELELASPTQEILTYFKNAKGLHISNPILKKKCKNNNIISIFFGSRCDGLKYFYGMESIKKLQFSCLSYCHNDQIIDDQIIDDQVIDDQVIDDMFLKFPNLETLYIHTDYCLTGEVFPKMKKLKKISINQCNNINFKYLEELNQIEELTLVWSELDDNVLEKILSLSKIKKLSLICCENITENAFSKIDSSLIELIEFECCSSIQMQKLPIILNKFELNTTFDNHNGVDKLIFTKIN